MNILLSSNVTAEAELDPDLVCYVCSAPSATTELDREVCVSVCVLMRDILKVWKMEACETESDKCKQEGFGSAEGWTCMTSVC